MSTQLQGVNLTDTPADTGKVSEGTQPTHRVGTRYVNDLGYEYVYVHADGAIAQYDFAVFDESFEAFKITAALAQSHPSGGVAQVAFADNDYGWLLTRGVGLVNVLANCAAEVQLYTSGTAGSLDDTDAGHRAVIGIRLSASVGGAPASAACYLDNPKTIVAFDGV